MKFLAYVVLGVFVLVGCQTKKIDTHKSSKSDSYTQQYGYQIDSPDVWGGEVRCIESECLLAAVEHENSVLVIYSLEKNGAKLLDKKPLGYHPDSAVWVNDNIVAAAVEIGQSIDLFDFKDGSLSLLTKLHLGFEPRNVIHIGGNEFRHQLLAVPYSGTTIAWIDLDVRAPEKARIKKRSWCSAPWFPVKVHGYPNKTSSSVISACRDDNTISIIPLKMDDLDMTSMVTLAKFSSVPSMVGLSPSSKWLYVALETGGKNARINLQTGEIQWIDATPEGSVAVVVLSDEKVIWGEDGRLIIQRIDDAGNVLDARWLPASGFSTPLQLVDLNADKEQDIVIYNSAGSRSDVIYGPLWEKGKKFTKANEIPKN